MKINILSLKGSKSSKYSGSHSNPFSPVMTLFEFLIDQILRNHSRDLLRMGGKIWDQYLSLLEKHRGLSDIVNKGEKTNTKVDPNLLKL